MADENKPAFYPRVGRNIAKNFRSAQPMPFIDDERAMEIPHEYYDIPTKENRELSRRRGERIADLERQKSADTSPLEKLAGGIQAGRFLGSALTQAINSAPTRLFKGDEAADKFMQERIYKPEQPLAYEYAQDVGDFLEKLETEYKIPPVLPEAVALQFLTAPATSQAARAAGRGALQAGMAVERGMEPVVRGALEQGGLPREMAMAMGANTQSNVIKPKGGNWLRGDVEKALDPLLAQGMINNRNIPYGSEFDVAIRQRIEDLKQAASQPDYKGGAGRVAEHLEREMENPRTNEVALNKWIQSNLTNYVKKEMGTPEDPVRKLAEQGVSHLPQDLQNIEMTWTPEELAKTRKRFGFPEEETATNPTAKMWEQMADEMIAPSRATEFGEKARQQNPWLEKLNPYDTVYETMRGMPQALKFDHIIDVLKEDLATGRIRPEQLNKVSMEQAVRRTFEYDQELAKKMAEARITARAELPVYKEYPEGLKWVELNRPGDFAMESDAMGHSVRGYEPPKGSADWTEGSGESGYGGYGLGGWEAIKKGKAKVYSLIDAKGEPHVTIEVGAYPDQLRAGNLKPYTQAAIEEAKLLPNGYTDADVRDIEIRMAKENMPKYINQIKGKQNAKPKEEYLPFVQDFVRGGNWSDVRDFQNTNLISADQVRKAGWDMSGVTQKYFTKQEYDDFLRAEQKRVEGDGMKRGGKVSISNNPDTMMLEVNNQKMKNGVPAYAGAGLIKGGLKAARPVLSDADRALPLRLTRAMPKSADEINAHAERVARQMLGEHVTSGKAGDTKNLAGRSMKESQRVKALEYELEPTKVVPESQVYQPRIGDINVALGGDFTVSDVMLKRLMGEEVNSKQEGGSRYGLGHMKAKTPLFYASNEVPAQAVQNKVTDLYDLFGPERVMGHHMAMGPIATNFAQHFADANLRYTDYSKLTPENMLMFDKLMAKGYEITKKNPKTGEVITKVVDFPKWPGIANPEAAYKAMRENSEMRKFYNKVMQTPSITEPLGLPNGLDVRYAITSPDLRDMEVNLTGHGVGELVPYGELTDTARHKTYSKGIPGLYEGHQEVLTPFAISFPDAAQHIISTQRPQDFTGTIQKVFPHQRVDQQFIDEIEQYRRRIKELTGKKKGGAVHKAAGGEITGDDLIIEERPL